jgi:hypothetical protein
VSALSGLLTSDQEGREPNHDGGRGESNPD